MNLTFEIKQLDSNVTTYTDINFSHLNKSDFKVGFVPEYIEKTFIGGMKKRRFLGYRLYVNWSYSWLSNDDKKKLFSIIKMQHFGGGSMIATKMRISVPVNPLSVSSSSIGNQVWEGNVFIDYNTQNTFFSYDESLGEYVWTGFVFEAKSVGYLS